MPGCQSSSRGPTLFTDVLGKRRFQTPHHSQERDPHQDLISYPSPLYSLRGRLADHLFRLSLFDHSDKLFVEGSVHRTHLWSTDVARKAPAGQHRHISMIVVANEFTQLLAEPVASLSRWTR